MCDKLEKLLKYLTEQKEYYDKPMFYQEQEYYDKCCAKSDLLEELIGQVNSLLKEEPENEDPNAS